MTRDRDPMSADRTAKIGYWICPLEGHSDSRLDNTGMPTQIVEWSGNVAYCLTPGCGRTSADPKPDGDETPQLVEMRNELADRVNARSAAHDRNGPNA